MKTLIVVDVQNDFVHGGALAVPDGHLVIPVANRVMPHFGLVVGTQDWHPANHLSFASQHERKQIGEVVEINGVMQVLWPDHCIQGTSGADFVAELNLDRIDALFHKGTNREIDSYSGFFDNGHVATTGLADFLDERGVREVYILGLATDYCVQFTALDARQLGLETYLISDGCRGVNLQPDDSEAAVRSMRDAGVHVLHSHDVIGKITQ